MTCVAMLHSLPAKLVINPRPFKVHHVGPGNRRWPF
jgi:hypothetical protein